MMLDRQMHAQIQPNDGRGGLVEPLIDVFMDPEAFGASALLYLDKPVIVLQSEDSVSAAETFALSMIQLPHVTMVGRSSIGSFSDTLERLTPNNWLFGLSNEYVRAPNGTVYEGIGIPVDVLLDGPFLPLADRKAGVDGWLETAIDTAAATRASGSTTAPTTSPSAAAGIHQVECLLAVGFTIVALAAASGSLL